MSKSALLISYLSYLTVAGTRHSIHSPFVYNLYENCILNKSNETVFKDIENIRKKLLNNKNLINITDHGTGTNCLKKTGDDVSNISKSPKQAQLLYRLVKYLKPKTIIELGTAMGLSTMYLASANTESKVITVDACPQRTLIAAENFKTLSFKNIELIVSPFDEALQKINNKITNSVMICLDGNHTKEATIRYFKNFLPFISDDSIMVIDDIHWSNGMTDAWNYIKQNPSVSITIDLFFMGLVFVRKGQAKQDFILRF